MNDWMHERFDKCMNDWLNVWMTAWMHEWMHECVDECMNQCIHEINLMDAFEKKDVKPELFDKSDVPKERDDPAGKYTVKLRK